MSLFFNVFKNTNALSSTLVFRSLELIEYLLIYFKLPNILFKKEKYEKEMIAYNKRQVERRKHKEEREAGEAVVDDDDED